MYAGPDGSGALRKARVTCDSVPICHEMGEHVRLAHNVSANAVPSSGAASPTTSEVTAATPGQNFAIHAAMRPPWL
ncbi:hypothetical protein C8259_04535 [Nocardia nova]|uniref:Uncharacterized protein n=1 Tax=Nocardia nova TaxID=37330 RepID=A0A2T2ZCG4_9NOCA|nr:hypothetical protein C8259_04535 [Nocardia nova]